MKRNIGCHIILLVSLLALVGCTALIFWKPELIDNREVAPDLTVLYALASAAVAFILAWIALINFKNIEHELSGSFLLEIDKRWSSKEILEARTLIHEVYRDAEDGYKEGQQRNISCLYAAVGEKLLHKYKYDPKQSMQLLNLLDLFESMGYFLQYKYIDKDQIQAFLGSSISFMWGVLKPIIEHRRRKRESEKEEQTNDKKRKMYSNFESMYKKCK